MQKNKIRKQEKKLIEAKEVKDKFQEYIDNTPICINCNKKPKIKFDLENEEYYLSCCESNKTGRFNLITELLDDYKVKNKTIINTIKKFISGGNSWEF